MYPDDDLIYEFEQEARFNRAYEQKLMRHPDCQDPDHPGCEDCMPEDWEDLYDEDA